MVAASRLHGVVKRLLTSITSITFITFITFITLTSPHLHMPNQMLVDPVIRVVHESLLRLL
jgi:hypothetical protein